MSKHVADDIVALKLPAINEVVVIGGAVMEIYGLRKAQDVDIVVSLKNWQYLQTLDGWTLDNKPDFRRFLTDENRRFDVWRWWFNPTDKSRTKLDVLKKNCWQHEYGFYVPSPKLQIALKGQLSRHKDDEDARLLKSLP